MQGIQATDDSKEMSYQVIEALAAFKDTDPLSMRPPLYDRVDTDALDMLPDMDAPVEIKFEYDGHTVVAESDGTITVDGVVFGSPDNRAAGNSTASQRVHVDD